MSSTSDQSDQNEETSKEEISKEEISKEEKERRKEKRKEKKAKKKEKKEKKKEKREKKRLKEAKKPSTKSVAEQKRVKVQKRTIKEYRSIVNNTDIGADIILVDEDDWTKYKIRFTPRGGHYNGQTMIIQIDVKHPSRDDYYPYCAPYVRMLNSVWHVNISSSGSICVDFLTQADKWVPTYGFEAIITAIQLLCEEPNPASPYNSQAASLFRRCEKDRNFAAFDARTTLEYNKHLNDGNNSILNDFNKTYNEQHPDREPVGV